MMEHMRHMGKSGKFAVISGVVAAGLLVLTGMTLAEPVLVAFLGVVALAYLAAVAELLIRGRRTALLATGAGTSLTLGCALAFLGSWELAFKDQSSFIGTPLPTGDPDDYFVAAAVSAAATLAVLFLGVAWPARRALPARKVSPGSRTPPARGATNTRPRQAGQRTAAPRAAAGQRLPGPRTPVRLPAGAKPPSSAAPARKPAPRSGSGSSGRR